jgi:hypothetical protein
MPGYTTQIPFIESALKQHKEMLSDLERSMDEFEPKAAGAFIDERNKMLETIKKLNPHKSEEEITTFVDFQISHKSSRSMQLLSKFSERYSAETVSIIILSHTLAEAAINAILAIGLEHVGKVELFNLIESANLKHKWAIGPKVFCSEYSFPKSSPLNENLSVLVKRRNSYVHSKITLHDDEDRKILSGSEDHSISLDKTERRKLHSYTTLPYDLHKHVLQNIVDPSLKFKLEHVLNSPVMTK